MRRCQRAATGRCMTCRVTTNRRPAVELAGWRVPKPHSCRRLVLKRDMDMASSGYPLAWRPGPRCGSTWRATHRSFGSVCHLQSSPFSSYSAPATQFAGLSACLCVQYLLAFWRQLLKPGATPRRSSTAVSRHMSSALCCLGMSMSEADGATPLGSRKRAIHKSSDHQSEPAFWREASIRRSTSGSAFRSRAVATPVWSRASNNLRLCFQCLFQWSWSVRFLSGFASSGAIDR